MEVQRINPVSDVASFGAPNIQPPADISVFREPGELELVDAAKWMRAAPQVFLFFHLCIVAATSREIATIKLAETEGLQDRHLTSNLVDLSQQGQGVFRRVQERMQTIAGNFDRLTKKDGVIDGLLKNFGDANGINSTRRLIKRLVADINESGEECQRMSSDFRVWREKLETLKLAISRTSGELGDSKTKQEKVRDELDGQIQTSQREVESARADLATAQQTHAQAQASYNEVRRSLGVTLTRTSEACTDTFLSFFTLTSVAFAKLKNNQYTPDQGASGKRLIGVPTVQSPAVRMVQNTFGALQEGIKALGYASQEQAAAQVVETARIEQERKTKGLNILEDKQFSIERTYESVRSELQNLETVIRLLSELMMRLEELNIAVEGIRDLIHKSQSEMKTFVDEYETHVQDLCSDVTEIQDWSQNERDFEDFFKNLLKMKEIAIALQVLSKLSATSIGTVLTSGFVLALESATNNRYGQRQDAVISTWLSNKQNSPILDKLQADAMMANEIYESKMLEHDQQARINWTAKARRRARLLEKWQHSQKKKRKREEGSASKLFSGLGFRR